VGFRRPFAATVACGFFAVLGFSPAAVSDGPEVRIEGIVEVDHGRLPDRLQVRATPVRGGAPRLAPVGEDGVFAIQGIAPGVWRFEVLLANGSVFAEAGAREVVLGPGLQTVTLVVQQGRTDPPPRGFAEWPRRRQVVVVVAGTVAGAAVCAAADCFGDDDASQSSP
jgi:hypothetical protein